MISKDLHGYTSPEAIREVDQTIAQVRLKQTPQEVEFITGSGIISDTVKRVLALDYKLTPRQKLGNSGVIVVYVE